MGRTLEKPEFCQSEKVGTLRTIKRANAKIPVSTHKCNSKPCKMFPEAKSSTWGKMSGCWRSRSVKPWCVLHLKMNTEFIEGDHAMVEPYWGITHRDHTLHPKVRLGALQISVHFILQYLHRNQDVYKKFEKEIKR